MSWKVWTCRGVPHCTKIKFSITDFFSKRNQIRKALLHWSHLLVTFTEEIFNWKLHASIIFKIFHFFFYENNKRLSAINLNTSLTVRVPMSKSELKTWLSVFCWRHLNLWCSSAWCMFSKFLPNLAHDACVKYTRKRSLCGSLIPVFRLNTGICRLIVGMFRYSV